MKRIAILLVVSACGTDGKTGDPGQGITDSVEVLCTKAFACKTAYPGTPASFAMVYGADQATCVMKNSPPDPFQEALDASVAAGRIVFSEADAKTCNDFVSALACDMTMMGFWGEYTLPAACDTATRGTVKLGETCTFWVGDNDTQHDVGDCADPNECSPDTSTCVAPQ